jgi:hypothetical protein
MLLLHISIGVDIICTFQFKWCGHHIHKSDLHDTCTICYCGGPSLHWYADISDHVHTFISSTNTNLIGLLSSRRN